MKKFVFVFIAGIAVLTTRVTGQSNVNVLNYAMPFLDLDNNARIAGMGGIGAVSSETYKDAGSYQNPALFAGSKRSLGLELFYMPWMPNSNINLYTANGYYGINEKDYLAFNYTYFDLGEHIYTNEQGTILGTDRFHEFKLGLMYSKYISEKFSLGGGVNYIKSDLGTREYEGGFTIQPANTFSIDMGMLYKSGVSILKNSSVNYQTGITINNVGPKVKYTDDPNGSKGFIPARLRCGVLVNPDFYLNEDLRFNIDIAYQLEKLLVPSTPLYDGVSDVILKGKDPDVPALKGIFQSFYDAPGGLSEELHEILHKFGAEVRLNYHESYHIAARFGVFREHETKGARKYNSWGMGIGVKNFTFDYGRMFKNKNNFFVPKNSFTMGFRMDMQAFNKE